MARRKKRPEDIGNPKARQKSMGKRVRRQKKQKSWQDIGDPKARRAAKKEQQKQAEQATKSKKVAEKKVKQNAISSSDGIKHSRVQPVFTKKINAPAGKRTRPPKKRRQK